MGLLIGLVAEAAVILEIDHCKATRVVNMARTPFLLLRITFNLP